MNSKSIAIVRYCRAKRQLSGVWGFGDVHGGGSQSVCNHCGANIYANDVFKKIKDLIG